MRAAVFKAAGEPLAIEERPDPAPAPDEVVIRIGRCGICGSDLGMTERHARTVPRGSVLGHEYAGEVVALGKEATRLKLGDRVTALPVRSCGRCAACLAGLPLHCAGGHFAFGGFAELIAASEANCIALPADLSLADGALVEPLAVGLHGVDLARPPIGARILILGAGPIGLTVAFWLHRFGHRRVAICASSTRNEALAADIGATRFLVAGNDLPQEAAGALGGAPEIVFECVGKPGMLARAIECVAPRGLVLGLGACWHPDPIDSLLALVKEVRVQFAVGYAKADFGMAVEALAAGAVEPRAMVTDTVTLDQLPATFEALRHRSHQCKVMIDPTGAHHPH